MKNNKNIFYTSNPLNLLDGLWQIVGHFGRDFSDDLIFLPSRRAVRSVEKMFTERVGGAVLLPKLVALGEGADENPDEEINSDNVVSNTTRLIVLANLLRADSDIKNFSTALTVAHDLLRMQDYLENEQINTTDINWQSLVDEKHAIHFQKKAKFLNLISGVLPQIFNDKITQTQKRNTDIRNWINNFDKYNRVIVCGSTASVPASADLMRAIADLPNGYIIFPGKIAGDFNDLELDTNPYCSINKFLKSVGMGPTDIKLLDTGASNIDLLNIAFGNSGQKLNQKLNAKLIGCSRESVEADTVAEIASRAAAQNKSVLIITPDAAGNQRIEVALNAHGMIADFSGGRSGGQTNAGRAILNFLDDCINNKNDLFELFYKKNNFNLWGALCEITDLGEYEFTPKFEIDSDDSIAVWNAIIEISDALFENGIVLELSDIRAIIADALSGVSVRGQMDLDSKIAVLGTIESRMQSADVIILTGLNDGMFPARGYENAWLPRHICEKIGLPTPDRKVSLMALDFMNLSCGENVYWLRSKTAGNSHTTESRFLSRVRVAFGEINSDNDILESVQLRDNVPYNPLDYSAPKPPADNSDIYVTKLELLIHNPYAFYANHILGLRPKRDFWEKPDARDFGNLVHSVIEKIANSKERIANEIVDELDYKAKQILPAGSAIFHFWHKRFIEMAPLIKKVLDDSVGGLAETTGAVKIADRIIRAKADRVWENHVLDIKTGSAPNKSQLLSGNMPQLPIEAFIMQNGGFPINKFGNREQEQGTGVVIQFLQLQNNNIELIEYSGDVLQNMINASVEKVSRLLRYYSTDFTEYDYRETNDAKYRAYDDLARVDD